jgi:hypothetical protein
MEYDHSFNKMERIMQIIRRNKKGSHVETVEKFRIFKEAMNNYQLKQTYKVQPNNIFETILQGESL